MFIVDFNIFLSLKGWKIASLYEFSLLALVSQLNINQR